MKDIILYFEPTEKVSVVIASDLKYTNVNNAIYIVDEIDKIVETKSISFKMVAGKYAICGLAAINEAEKVYMLSATYG